MMRLVTDDFTPETAPAAAAPAAEERPAEVDLILSAMDAAKRPQAEASNRRAAERRPLRVRADLRLFAHDPLDPPTALYTRDVSATGVGFITKTRLPLGYNGLVRFTIETGETITAACSVYRCREAIGGWYEGALHFTNRQLEVG